MSGVGVGVIGAGIMGADHANTVHRKLSGARLVAVTDVDRNRARAVADAAAGVTVIEDGFALITTRRWTRSSSPRTTPRTPS